MVEKTSGTQNKEPILVWTLHPEHVKHKAGKKKVASATERFVKHQIQTKTSIDSLKALTTQGDDGKEQSAYNSLKTLVNDLLPEGSKVKPEEMLDHIVADVVADALRHHVPESALSGKAMYEKVANEIVDLGLDHDSDEKISTLIELIKGSAHGK